MLNDENIKKFVDNLTYPLFQSFKKFLDERYAREPTLEHFINPKGSLVENEKYLVRVGEKIKAIKEVRNRTGSGLKEAKDLVDQYFAKPY